MQRSGDDHEQKLRGFGDVHPRELAARWALWQVEGLGFRGFARLLDETAADLHGLFERDACELRQVLERAHIGEKLTCRIQATVREVSPEVSFQREIERLSDDTAIIPLGGRGYPPRLLDLDEPPVFIYVRGTLDGLAHRKTIAIVGSRKATINGVRLARSIAAVLARQGVVVISGGALGIDAAAHRGCLEGGSPTVSVLAGGVDRPTPRKNAEVFRATVEQGALLSEYAHGTRPRRFHFHRRNELIAALGDATLVVRAAESSGTMITARAAHSLERPVCALPGALDDPLSQGCHKLLVEGAACVRDANDILAHVFSSPATPRQLSFDARSDAPKARPGEAPGSSHSEPSRPAAFVAREALSEDAGQLLDAVHELAGSRRKGVALDEIKRHLAWPALRLNPALLELELGNAIVKRAGANVFRPL